jgi:hypothetical protein
MYGVLNEIYLQNFFMMSVTFRDEICSRKKESNESSPTMIGYSNATVIIL